MAPKAASILARSGGTATVSDEACTPCAGNCGFRVTWHPTHCCALCQKKRGAAHGPRCERKTLPGAPDKALGDASSSPCMPVHDQTIQGRTKQNVFPYGITVPFRVRDAVPGNKSASAQVFLSEAPISALQDMCFYLQIEEAGSIDDLVGRLINYFSRLDPNRPKTNSERGSAASGPTPARARVQIPQSVTADVHGVEAKEDGGCQELRARLQKLGKVTFGSKESLVKRLQEAEAEIAKNVDAKKRKRTSEESKPALKKQKTTDKLQT